MNMHGSSSKVVVITGASSGIGEAQALVYALAQHPRVLGEEAPIRAVRRAVP